MAVCLATALTSAVLATNAFTLAWTHSIEKIRWEEEWIVREDGLQLATARIRGHGAGMEVPPGAMLRDGAWQWHPRSIHARLQLTRSGFTADYEWCLPGQACRPLHEILPSDGAVTAVWPCDPAAHERGFPALPQPGASADPAGSPRQ